MDMLFSVLMFLIVSSCSFYTSKSATVDVTQFSAVGDGKTDDSQAFLKAWEAVCNGEDATPTLLLPEGKIFMLQPIEFKGPCKSNSIVIQVSGNIVAPESYQNWKPTEECWLMFYGINGLVIQGSGTIDGQGVSWWEKQIKIYKRPRATCIRSCNSFNLKDITLANSPRSHIAISNCQSGLISNINITAPENSPNTDGIDISSSSQLQIQNSFIGTGDDCIAIGTGSSTINITGIQCGPGHGISVGSLGHGTNDTVEEVYVQNCNFTGTQNGARIKTFETGSGYARHITFENINFKDSENPIIINQHYHQIGLSVSQQIEGDGEGGYVRISDVKFKDMEGTTSSKEAITLDCCELGCSNIVVENVKITSSEAGESVVAVCNNVSNGTFSSTTPTVSCLSKDKLY